MGKSKKKSKKNMEEREPLFSPEEADADEDASNGAGDEDAPGGIAADGGPATRYRDDPSDSIFDWNGDGAPQAEDKGRDGDDDEAGGEDAYQVDEFDPDAVGFAPISLHDDDSDSGGGGEVDEESGGARVGGDDNRESIRIKANRLLNERVFDDDEDEDRIFVGGGWGRHGSQTSPCPRGICALCCGERPDFSRGPHGKRGRSPCQLACMMIAFLAVVFGSGFLGYEAGLPVEDDDEAELGSEETNDEVVHHTHPKGQEWLEWLERERQEMHPPHWNFTLHRGKHDKGGGVAVQSRFEAKTQADLLRLSEHVFQSCSERSLRTTDGRGACLSLCQGRYCCFEKDPAYGSCVAEAHSYCFAYAACENAIADFEMNNANTQVKERPVGQGHNSREGMLDALDVKLLGEACSEESVATAGGRSDCAAFCQHHLCCFDHEGPGNCRAGYEGTCEAYDSCKILLGGPEEVAGTSGGSVATPKSGGSPPSSGGGGGPEFAGEGGATSPLVSLDHDALAAKLFQSDCTEDNLRDNWDLCKTLCSKYECCFLLSGSCYADNKSECDFADVCVEYFVDDVEYFADDVGGGAKGAGGPDAAGLTRPQQQNWHEISNLFHQGGLCAAPNIAENWDCECEAACRDFECCWSRVDSCFSTEEAWCDMAAPCEQFLVDDKLPQATNGPGETQQPHEWHDEMELFVQGGSCSDPDGRGDNWDECELACQEFECCWSSHDSCYISRKPHCDMASSCERYLNLDSVEPYIEKNQLPQQAGGPTDYYSPEEDSDSVNQDIVNAIHAVCSLQMDDPSRNACRALCEDYLCCFSSEGESCRGRLGEDVCNAYEGCMALNMSPGAEAPPEPTTASAGAADARAQVKAVREACVNRAKRDPWLADRCRKACEPRSCCFASGEFDCSSLEGTWCDEFAACEILYT